MRLFKNRINISFFISFITVALVCGLVYAETYVDTPGRVNPNRTLDTKTPLEQLIKRLVGWQEEVTGKAYWIGYNNDMYSIAAYHEKAIQPLLDFIDKSKSGHDKYGAILTIHLIGINSHVAGRFYEEFTNEKAREALLYLLKNEDLQIPILELLIRDPWSSDLPELFKILQGKNTSNSWAFVKALQRYKIKNRPVHQDLPSNFTDSTNYRIEWRNKREYYEKAVNKLTEISNGRLMVEPGLLDVLAQNMETAGYVNVTFEKLLHELTDCEYMWLGDKLDYYYEGGKIYLCSVETIKKRWLDWYKNNYTSSIEVEKSK